MSKLQSVRGTHDLIGENHRAHRWLRSVAQKWATRYGFSGIETPIFEFSEVFERPLGPASDIVNKERYIFEDRSGDSLTLRPEGTAAIARAFLSEGLTRQTPQKLFYCGPMFRYERPQKGRQRQFHQFGVEILGAATPQADTESIAIASNILGEIGLAKKFTLEVNTLGDTESRQAYRTQLLDFLNDHKQNLSEDSQKRLATNPLRILDSKDSADQEIIKDAPSNQDTLSSLSKDFYLQWLEGLRDLKIKYNENHRLVRGLDYYSHSVFEFKAEGLGARDTVIGGGRYDQLVEMMGGPSTAGVGWAAGMEALLLVCQPPKSEEQALAIIPLNQSVQNECLKLSEELRKHGFIVEQSYSGNLSKRMKKANQSNCCAALILGEEEIKQNQIQVKNLETGNQKSLHKSELIADLMVQFPQASHRTETF